MINVVGSILEHTTTNNWMGDKMPYFEINCEICGAYSREWRAEKPHRFCGEECRRKGMVGYRTKRNKHTIDPKHDERIRKVYMGTTGNGEIKALASWLGVPRQTLTTYANKNGWTQKAVKSPPWTPEEDAALEKYARYCIEKISVKMRQDGFNRTNTAIAIRLKRKRLLSNLDGYSATQLSECLGIDAKSVTRLIQQNKLRAEKRGTARTEKQGGDAWWIKPRYIRNYLMDYIGEIDMRKIDRFWFVDMLCNPNSLV